MTVGQTAVVVLSPSCKSDAEADDDVDKTNEENDDNDDNNGKDCSLSTVTMMMTMTLNKRSLVDLVDL